MVLGIGVGVALALSGMVPGLGSTAPRAGATPTAGGRARPTTGPATVPTRSSATGRTPPGPLSVVGLGDSVPSATTCDCTGYVEQVGAELQRLTDRPWVVHNDATDGWTTADVEDHLRSRPTRDHLSDADLVIVEVGANDFDLDKVADRTCFPAATSTCFAPALDNLRAGLTHIVSAIRAVDHRPDLRIAVVGYWNVTLDGRVGRALGEDFVLGSDELTRSVNTTVQQVAASTGTVYVDAYTPLKGDSGTEDPTGKLLGDGDHPNASGHTVLATAVLQRLVVIGAVEGWSAATP